MTPERSAQVMDAALDLRDAVYLVALHRPQLDEVGILDAAAPAIRAFDATVAAMGFATKEQAGDMMEVIIAKAIRDARPDHPPGRIIKL